MLVPMRRELSRPNTTIETCHNPDTPIDQEISDDILTLPNLVTTIGGLCSIYGIRNADTIKGIAALIIGELSDKADGTLARRLHQQSKLGIKLDPIRDKVVAATALLKIVEDGLASKTVVASMTSLEATKAIATLIAEHKHRQLPDQAEPLRPTQAGRISGALVSTATSLCILSGSARSFGHEKTAKVLRSLGDGVSKIYLPVAGLAAAQYIIRAAKLSKQVKDCLLYTSPSPRD